MARLAPQQLLAPIGELETAMFPGLTDDQVTERVQTYLEDGYAKAGDIDAAKQDDAARAWAYYRAYKARVIQLAAEPSAINIPSEISTSRTDAQRATFERFAAEWLDAFYGYTAAGQPASDLLIPASGTSKTHFGWGGTLRGTQGG